MKLNRFVIVLLVLLFTVAVAAEDKDPKFIEVPKTIINEDIPQIPIDIMKKMEQYTMMKSTSFQDWNPTGKGMIVSTRLGNTTQLYMIDSPLGKLRQLTDFEEPVSQAEFCPNPEKGYFIFVKDIGGGETYQYFRYDLKTGKHTMITDGKSRHMGLSFNHKGDKIAYVNNSRTGMFFDVYVMDPEKPGSQKMVMKAERPAYYIPTGWSEKDNLLFLVEYFSINEANTYVIDMKTMKSRKIDPKCDAKCVFMLTGTDKSEKIAYGITDKAGEFSTMITYDLNTGSVKYLTADIHWDIQGGDVSPCKKKVVFTVNEGGMTKLYIMDLETYKYKPIGKLPVGIVSGVTFNKANGNLALNINGPRMNGDIYEMDIKSENLNRWTKSDTGGLDTSKFVEPEIIEFPTFDKVDGKPRMIPAFYYKPVKKSDKPYPVIVYIHGGPEGQYTPRFSSTLSYWVNELGIAVVATNVRGSSGYGKSFVKLDNWEKREDSVKDIGGCLDWIATQPELDKKRVSVYGGSYGGYMVLASMITYGDRLASGVDIVGISNFVTFLKNTSAYRRDLRRAEYGDERKIGDFLEKISPTTNAHKIMIPLFVIQGKNDPRVPWTEAIQIVKTVRKNNVPVWYQLATNEGHGFRKKNNRDFMNYSVIKFFQEYLLK
jgi:dipeptidyl aminopeptidase/acylaminoacyl peptidase